MAVRETQKFSFRERVSLPSTSNNHSIRLFRFPTFPFSPLSEFSTPSAAGCRNCSWWLWFYSWMHFSCWLPRFCPARIHCAVLSLYAHFCSELCAFIINISPAACSFCALPAPALLFIAAEKCLSAPARRQTWLQLISKTNFSSAQVLHCVVLCSAMVRSLCGLTLMEFGVPELHLALSPGITRRMRNAYYVYVLAMPSGKIGGTPSYKLGKLYVNRKFIKQDLNRCRPARTHKRFGPLSINPYTKQPCHMPPATFQKPLATPPIRCNLPSAHWQLISFNAQPTNSQNCPLLTNW